MAKNMRIKPILLLSCALLPLAACSGIKQQLGMNRNAPDEFAVVKRAPLELPPDYTLRPPSPGAPRPQEQSTNAQARETVFGGEAQRDQQNGTGEDVLLQSAGADRADPSIRGKVDRETAAMAPKQQPAVKKLFNIGRKQQPETSVVNAEKEAERIQGNVQAGRPVTTGETPSIRQ